MNLTQEQFQNLKTGWNRAKKRKFHVNGKKGSTLNEFIMSERKGSKRFREIFTKNSRMDHEKNLKNLQQVKTFSSLTGSVNIEIRLLKSMMGALRGTITSCRVK